MKKPDLKRLPPRIILIAILLVSAALRLYHIDFGKPHTFHPDEMKLIAQAGHLLDTFFVDKDAYFVFGVYPVFFTIILAFVLAFYILLAIVSGRFESLHYAQIAYENNPFTFFLTGRLFVAVLGVLSVYILYKLCKQAYNRRMALVAAAFLGMNFIHVRNSHFATVDVPATLFALLAFYFMMRIYNRDELKDYLLTALFMSFAVASKFSLLFIALPFFYICVVQFAKSKKSRVVKKIIAAIVTGIVFFFIASPIFLLDFQETMGGIAGTTEFEKVGKIGSGGGFLSYWTGKQAPGFGMFYPNSIPDTFGIPLTLLVVAGLAYQIHRHRHRDLLFLLFIFSTYFMFDHFAYKAMRHILPIIPLLLLSAALILDSVVGMLRIKRLYQNIILSILVIVFVFPGVSYSLYYFSVLSEKDPRSRAAEWIEHNIPPGSRLAVESFAPPVKPDSSTGRFYEFVSIKLTQRQAGLAPVLIDTVETCDYYISDGFSRSFFNWRETRERYLDIVKDRRKFFNYLENEFRLIKHFKATDEHLQPGIAIYKNVDQN
jgi:4-amino-4-deoxy-L-arabinose transferase-like glycosyltransferase